MNINTQQMYKNIPNKDATMLASVMIKQSKSIDKIEENVQLIDHMLSVMKAHSLLNRKKNHTKRILDGLLALSVGDSNTIPGTQNNHLIC